MHHCHPHSLAPLAAANCFIAVINLNLDAGLPLYSHNQQYLHSRGCSDHSHDCFIVSHVSRWGRQQSGYYCFFGFNEADRRHHVWCFCEAGSQHQESNLCLHLFHASLLNPFLFQTPLPHSLISFSELHGFSHFSISHSLINSAIFLCPCVINDLSLI